MRNTRFMPIDALYCDKLYIANDPHRWHAYMSMIRWHTYMPMTYDMHTCWQFGTVVSAVARKAWIQFPIYVVNPLYSKIVMSFTDNNLIFISQVQLFKLANSCEVIFRLFLRFYDNHVLKPLPVSCHMRELP